VNALVELWPLLLLLGVTGLLAGLIAGLLGIGGGIVLVPVLDYALQRAGFPSAWSMHVAVATSLATIIPTAIASSRAHHARGGVDWSLAKSWAPGMLVGGLLGSLFAAAVSGQILATLFGITAAFVAIKMALPFDHWRIRDQVPRGSLGNFIAAIIGTLSAMMGIGGGTLSVPVMTLTGGAIHQAVGTAAFFGLLLAVPGTLGYLLANPGVELPGFTVGLVSFAALLIVAPTSVLTAPLGARLAHRLQQRRLSQIFAVFLCLVAVRMIQRSFT
jgi:uncharacterized membrane protein YfcA